MGKQKTGSERFFSRKKVIFMKRKSFQKTTIRYSGCYKLAGGPTFLQLQEKMGRYD